MLKISVICFAAMTVIIGMAPLCFAQATPTPAPTSPAPSPSPTSAPSATHHAPAKKLSNAKTNQWAKLSKGTIETGGSASANYSNSGSNTEFLSGTLKYFIFDRFDFGFTATETWTESGTIGTEGVVATYFFDQDGPVVLDTSLIYELTTSLNGSTLNIGGASLGMKYFLIPAISIGPTFAYKYFYSPPGGNTKNVVTISLSFSLFL